MYVIYNLVNAFSNPTTRVLTDRVQQLKDARNEAAKEIEEYRAGKEQEFAAFQSTVSPSILTCTRFCSTSWLTCRQHAGTTQDAQSIIDKETEEKLSNITGAYTAHKDDVLRKLLDRVVLVQPQLHRNLKKQQ
jgi:V-type H+-transporting ATPase subunit G